MINDNKCAPSKKYINGSCFSYDSLKKIAYKYNINNNDNININLPKTKLVEILNNKLNDRCSNQVCWLKLDFLKELKDDDINNNTFRPVGPSKKYEWLSTTDIQKVINQYQYKYQDFYFLGTVPYDFEDLSFLNLKNLDFDELYDNGKTKLGLVINLDEHYKNGSHWVSLYTDLKKNQVYFFDSVGKPPRKRIKKFITKIIKFLYKKNFNETLKIKNIIKFLKDKNNTELSKKYLIYVNNIKNFDIRYNNTQHQFKNSECGVYSIYFIVKLLDSVPFNYFLNNVIKDEEINEFRKEYFINVN
jgi:hypothetical protein